MVASRIRRARAGRHLLLLLDFDGTLCGFVDDPAEAALPPRTATALLALAAADHVTVGFVSGRRAADLRRRLPALPDGYVAGCHGLEIDGPGGRFVHAAAEAGATAAQRIAAMVSPRLRDWPGTRIEDKGLSAALHVRGASAQIGAAATAAFKDAAAEAVGAGLLRVLDGACVTELVPAIDWHKGRAVDWIRQRVAAANGPLFTVYAGDDVTDEDAFRALTGDGFSIAVGDRARGADCRLEDPDAVAALLDLLARTGATGPP